MRTRSKARSHAPGRPNLFGPPPILPGENPKAYEEILNRIIDTIAPRDFIEEIWCRDLADVAFNLFRLRRIKAAYQADGVSEAANKKASRLAEATMRAMEDSDEHEILQFLACLEPGCGVSARPSDLPRAPGQSEVRAEHGSHPGRCDPELVVGLLRADRSPYPFRRFDEIVRELDRHPLHPKSGRKLTVARASQARREPKIDCRHGNDRQRA
jgi:hypothetical protein